MNCITFINNLKKQCDDNQSNITNLVDVSYLKRSSSFIKALNKISIDTTLTYYDLYNFLGTTYTSGSTPPTPVSAYTGNATDGWTFKYPIYGFRTLLNQTPESLTDNAGPWEFQTTIALVQTNTQFIYMPEWAFDGCKVISYLYNTDGTIVEDLKFTLLESGQNQDEIYVDFTTFHKWAKLENGYELHFFAMFPIPENEDIKLNTYLYIYNPKGDYYAQQIKI